MKGEWEGEKNVCDKIQLLPISQRKRYNSIKMWRNH